MPYIIEQDEDGVWCAHAQLRPGVGAHGQGDTQAAAVDDLREALAALIEEVGVPSVPGRKIVGALARLGSRRGHNARSTLESR